MRLAAVGTVGDDLRIATVLVAVDFSEGADAAIEHAAGIARHLGARIVLAHAHLPLDTVLARAERDTEEMLRGRLEQLQAGLKARGLTADIQLLLGSAPAILAEAAAQLEADLIVMGSRGLTGFRRFLLGSVAERVVRTAQCPVLIARPGERADGGYRRVLVATDFSPGADRALAAARLLGAPDAQIDLLHCWQVPYLASGSRQSIDEVSRRLRNEFEAQFDRLREAWPTGGAALRCENLCKPPAHGIQWWIEQHPQDLVIVGRHGRRGLRQVLLGSVAEMTARYSPCPVAVIPP